MKGILIVLCSLLVACNTTKQNIEINTDAYSQWSKNGDIRILLNKRFPLNNNNKTALYLHKFYLLEAMRCKDENITSDIQVVMELRRIMDQSYIEFNKREIVEVIKTITGITTSLNIYQSDVGYTKAQLLQIIKKFEIAHNNAPGLSSEKLSVLQMFLVVTGNNINLDTSVYNKPKYSPRTMAMILSGLLKADVDITAKKGFGNMTEIEVFKLLRTILIYNNLEVAEIKKLQLKIFSSIYDDDRIPTKKMYPLVLNSTATVSPTFLKLDSNSYKYYNSRYSHIQKLILSIALENKISINQFNGYILNETEMFNMMTVRLINKGLTKNQIEKIRDKVFNPIKKKVIEPKENNAFASNKKSTEELLAELIQAVEEISTSISNLKK